MGRLIFILIFILANCLDLPQATSNYIVESPNHEINLELEFLPKLDLTLAPSQEKALAQFKKAFCTNETIIERSLSLYHHIDLPPPAHS